MKRWIPLALLAVFFSLMLILRWMGLPKLMGHPTSYLGAGPVLAGAVLTLAALRQLSVAQTTIKAFGEPTRLVTGGIYRYTRNPIYLGLALMLMGGCILLGGRCMVIPVFLFVGVADRWIIRAEEKLLSRAFGSTFADYRSKTPRWI